MGEIAGHSEFTDLFGAIERVFAREIYLDS
jgi:hypothetical protein